MRTSLCFASSARAMGKAAGRLGARQLALSDNWLNDEKPERNADNNKAAKDRPAQIVAKIRGSGESSRESVVLGTGVLSDANDPLGDDLFGS